MQIKNILETRSAAVAERTDDNGVGNFVG